MDSLTLAQLLKENDVPNDVLTLLAKPPFKITTIKQFANYFESKAEVFSLCLKESPFKEEGDTIANLKKCWGKGEG